ncbi:hypothetical protein ACHAWF_014880, partial [Thalassiosira exigua]
GEHNLFQRFASASARHLLRFNAQSTSNLAYAYALIKHNPILGGGSNLFDLLARQSVHLFGKFKPQDFSNLVWAFATVKVSNPELFAKVAEAVVARDLNSFNAQELANIVWAYATAEAKHPDIFRKIADVVVSRDLDSFNAQNLTNIVWAFATAKEKHHCLFRKIAGVVVARDLKSFKPQELANIVWAYATAAVSHPRLFEIVANELIGRDLKSFMPQNLAMIAWAYVTANICHSRLFNQIAGASIASCRGFNPQDTANLLWAYASIGQVHQSLFASFSTTAATLIEQCNVRELANIARAFAVANVDAPNLFSARFVDALTQKSNTFTVEDFGQLHQWQLWRVEMNARVRLPPSIQDRCCVAFTSSSIHVSDFQKDVVCELSAIGLQPKDEVLLPSGYRLDALVEVYGQRVGIEVDGPSNFIDGMPTTKTMLKQRQVAAIDGIAIVSIPYWEWDRLGNDRDARQRYLWSKLALFSVPYYPPNTYAHSSFDLHMPSQAHFQRQRQEGLGESVVWFGRQEYFN